MLKLKMVSDGTLDGTKLVDAATGEPFTIENGTIVCHVKGQEGHGSATVKIVVNRVPVVVSAPDVAPFEFIGHHG